MKEIKILLLYPPEQSWPMTMVKPNGSLAYPYLSGALRDIGVESHVYDACVGNDDDSLNNFYSKGTPLPSGMIRTGVSNDRILEIASNYDAIGITSIFSQQETQVLNCAKLIKKNFPNKLLFSGGVNAKSRSNIFFDAGFDIIFTSESEISIQQVARIMQKGSRDFASVGKIYFRNKDGKIVDNSHFGEIFMDLDKLPIPAWEKLPNKRYWEIGRPHGGKANPGQELRYASMMTSRGCPFSCSYCHIAEEIAGSKSGAIGKFRFKSDDRVINELTILKNDIGAKQVFIEDDSIFGMKRRAIRLLKRIVGFGLDLMDVNGINMIHLVKKSNKPGWMVPDEEVIELLAAVGFKEIVLPFESANPRIIKKWCSNKLALDRFNPGDLIKTIKKHKMYVGTNYMIGFPDETRKEIENTVNFGKKMKEYGLDHSNFYLVMPVPGTPIFDYCTKNKHLPLDYNPDRFQWTKANLKNTEVNPEELEKIRDNAWEMCNSEEFKNLRKSWVVGN
ncbi:radical SAM protein [Pelagibacteraceae bacterium]|nr:radical SAM protein [Pelagibacteraceae bacterium]